MNVVLVIGEFDPFEPNHLNYLEHAAKLGEKLVVALHSDEYLKRKKNCNLLSFEERADVLRDIYFVDEVVGFDDSNNTGTAAIFDMLACTSHRDRIIMAMPHGPMNTPEETVYGDGQRVKFKYNIGKEA